MKRKILFKWISIWTAMIVMAVVFFVACEEGKVTQVDLMESHTYNIKVIDSCEYISVSTSEYYSGLAHKGNCRFCKERHEQEMKELIKQLKK